MTLRLIMSKQLCRLCLSNKELVNVFNPKLINGEILRSCIFLCSGVNIQLHDNLSKHICFPCCRIAIKSYRFRKRSITNDKKCRISSEDSFDQNQQVKSPNPPISLETTVEKTPKSSFHWTVHQVLNKMPKINLPNQALSLHLKPVVVLKQLDINKLSNKKSVTDDKTCDKSKKADSPKQRNRSDSESSEVIPTKRKRVFTKKSKAFRKMDLPERLPTDVESQKLLFMSSLEMVPSKKSSNDEKLTVPTKIKQRCLYCSRSFRNPWQIKMHIMKYHRCKICNVICDSKESLRAHLQEICYEGMKNKLPTVLLKRVEKDASISKIYPKIFHENETQDRDTDRNVTLAPVSADVCINSQDNKQRNVEAVNIIDDLTISSDDSSIQSVFSQAASTVVYVSSDDEDDKLPKNSPFTNTTPAVIKLSDDDDDDDDVVIIENSNESDVNESSNIRHIFEKYFMRKSTFSQTENNPRVKNGNTNGILLKNVFRDLSFYKIPVRMSVDETFSAQISDVPEPHVREE